MAMGLLGRKLGMTRIFDGDGNVVPVTVVQAGPCQVSQVKTLECDGYKAVQIGFEDKRHSRSNQCEIGHARKAGIEPKRVLREIRLQDDQKNIQVGATLTVEMFEDVKQVDVTGTTKGRGFTGVMKRHGFRGGPASHGHTWHRRGGSIGAASYPSRVFPGMRMPGHMGNKQFTVTNLKVVDVDKAAHVLLVRGAVPGANGSVVFVHPSKR